MNETLIGTDGRWVLRFERRLTHPVEKVWRAITEPAELSGWFPADMEMDLQEGGKILFVFREGEGPTQDGSIVELDPPRVFAYTWGDDLLRWELWPEDGGCRLVFTHTFDDRPSAASFAAGWTICLAALHRVAAGQPLTGADAGTPGADPLAAADLAAGGPAPRRVSNDLVPAGVVTAVRPPNLLETDWRFEGRPVGRVRWELSDGRGGARLTLAQTGPAELAAHRATALAAWHTQLELLADHLRGRTRPWPEGRTEELTRHYADLIG